MSAKRRGLGPNVLGDHFGFDMPEVVRRTSEPASAPATLSEIRPGFDREDSGLHTIESSPELEAAPASASAAASALATEVPAMVPPAIVPSAKAAATAEDEGESEAEAAPVERKLPAQAVSARDEHLDPKALPVSDPSAARSHLHTTAEPSDPAPPRKLPTSGPINRTGTKEHPYTREDGVRTRKVSFTLPWTLARELDIHCTTVGVERAEWVREVLERALARESSHG